MKINRTVHLKILKLNRKINKNLINKFTTFILEEIGEKINELMIDRYGNYFFQELIRKWDDAQRLSILQNIKTNFIQISTDKKGTHTVQRLIDMVSTIEEEKALHECIQDQVVKLCMDQQGTHVMQKYVKAFPEEKREFVIDELLDNEVIIKVSKNSYGLAVMKKVIKFTEKFETRRRLMKIISKHTEILVQDPYGNYVLQESLDNWHDTDPDMHEDNDNCFFANLFKKIEGKIEKLSIQKFSSNVIEKWLERANDYYRRIFIKEIIKGDSVDIMKNSYGNYVFQKSLALARGIDKFRIIDVIFKNFPTIQDQKIKMKWVKLLKKNIKQDDVLEADEEQDTLNLPIESMINYSHKYKLINDELSRYDPNQANKKDKKSKKKSGNMNQPKGSYSATFPTAHTFASNTMQYQQYAGNVAGMYPPMSVPIASMMPPPPPPMPLSYSYQQVPMMGQYTTTPPQTYPGGYFKSPSNLIGPDGYPINSGFSQK